MQGEGIFLFSNNKDLHGTTHNLSQPYNQNAFLENMLVIIAKVNVFRQHC